MKKKRKKEKVRKKKNESRRGYAKVIVEHEASLVYEASPWAVDKRAAEIVRPAPVQSAASVPPKSPAREVAFA